MPFTSETKASSNKPAFLQYSFWIGFTVTWIGFTLMYGARLDYIPGSQVIWAGLASLGFLVAACTRRMFRDSFSFLVFLGLIGCWLGDVLGPSDFMTGVYAFFAAHCLFIAACWRRGVNWRKAGLATAPVLLVSAIVLVMILPGMPDEEVIMMLAYSALISVMVIVAVGAGAENMPLIAAAITFFVSDVFLAFWRFADSSASGWLCYPFYYSACLLFAYSIHLERLRRVHHVDSENPADNEGIPEQKSSIYNEEAPCQTAKVSLD